MLSSTDLGLGINVTVRYLDSSEIKVGAHLGDKVGLFRHANSVGVAGPGQAILILDRVEVKDNSRTLAQGSNWATPNFF